jgi:putative ABC transport system substrate-binding protein
MNRREFMSALGVGAAWPHATQAQQPAVPVIGFLTSGSANSNAHIVDALHQGLSEVGYVEHRNVAIEYRWAEDQYDRLPALAADLVRLKVAVIVAVGALPVTLAAKQATATIPIVFGIGGDPVQLGFVANLSRPGGNLTGVTNLNTEVLPKRLELLREVLPGKTSIAGLVNPANPAAESQTRDLQAAARILGLQFHIVHASTEGDFDAVLATQVKLRASGLVIAGDGVFVSGSKKLAALALRHEVPAIFQFREFVAAGGLMSYGSSSGDQSRLAGHYSGRILKGEKPSDLPVQRSTKVELIVNFKTAKTLGLAVPLTLRGRADEVIE